MADIVCVRTHLVCERERELDKEQGLTAHCAESTISERHEICL